MNAITIKTVAVMGAGTMGQGIAQVSALAGCRTLLYDSSPGAIEKAMDGINQNLSALLRKEKISEAVKTEIIARITAVHDPENLVADLVIEAVVEQISAKKALFAKVEVVNRGQAILATNTSSLSINEIAADLKYPEMFLGIHFFNPAPVMKLVEIISSKGTDQNVLRAVSEFLIRANKTTVLCADFPGFIVNRVARHFYLESLKILEERIADPSQIDSLMRSAGFKMGPFELMDLIGIDVNYSVSESIYSAFGRKARFKPSAIQREKVEQGKLGRKTGEGFYKY